MSCTWNICKYS